MSENIAAVLNEAIRQHFSGKQVKVAESGAHGLGATPRWFDCTVAHLMTWREDDGHITAELFMVLTGTGVHRESTISLPLDALVEIRDKEGIESDATDKA